MRRTALRAGAPFRFLLVAVAAVALLAPPAAADEPRKEISALTARIEARSQEVAAALAEPAAPAAAPDKPAQ